MPDASMNGPAPRWLARLHEILAKVGLRVRGIAAIDGDIDVAIEGEWGSAIVVEVRPLDPGARWIATTERCGLRCRAGALSEADRAALDLAVKVLCRIEPRLPAERPGAATIGDVPEDPHAAVPRAFPFASVERSDTGGRAQTEVMVRLGPACNQSCPFCSAPPHREPDDARFLACLAWAASTHPGCRLVLTGGEPTLRRTFAADLAVAMGHAAFAAIEVQTNAVPLAREGAVAALPRDPRLVFFVSLHALDPEVYDRCTGTKAQLPRALDGIRSLLADGRDVRLNAVASGLNLGHLRDLVAGLPDALAGVPRPRLHFSSLMCPPYRPGAADCMARYSDLVPVLEAAAADAARLGFEADPLVSSTHASVPPCLVGPEHQAALAHRPEPSGGETGYEDFDRPWVKAASCRACRHAARCLGLPAPYARRFGFGELRPVPADEAVARMTRRTLDDPAAITAAAAAAAVEMPAIEDVADGDEPVRLSELTARLPATSGIAGGGPEVRSRVGRPLCLFPGSLMRVVLGQPGPREGVGGGEAAFGPQCAGCLVRGECSGVSPAYARRFGTGELRPFVASGGGGATWEDRARWLLLDRPGVAFRLSELLPAGALPGVRCVLPWTRLELHEGGTFAPCCADYVVAPAAAPGGADVAALWASPTMAAFRDALRTGEWPRTCRESCPILAGGTALPGDLRLAGGAAAFVENQLATVRGLLAGSGRMDAGPLHVAFSATSHCNYDCLMCDCGERGTLDDQKDDAFYRGLAPLMAAVATLEVNGGEPFASPAFRAFVERLAASDDRRCLTVVTNGSLLTPAWLATLPRLPFAGLVVSLNAATAGTYRDVNRGLPFERVRRNLDELLRLRREGRLAAGLTWSMVVVRRNLAEVVDFARLGLADGAEVRYLLPIGDRNGQSVLADRDAMEIARDALAESAGLLDTAGLRASAAGARACARVIADRLARGITTAIPRGEREPAPRTGP
jgi:MoaA/NifB/PqqE/SkfB family radical SAM enzyme